MPQPPGGLRWQKFANKIREKLFKKKDHEEKSFDLTCEKWEQNRSVAFKFLVSYEPDLDSLLRSLLLRSNLIDCARKVGCVY